MSHIATIVTRRGLVRLMDGLDVTSLLRTRNLEDLADLLGVQRRVIEAHFPTRRGYVLTVFDSRDGRWTECLSTVLRDHGTFLGLERALRDFDTRMPLLEFTMADAPGQIDDSIDWAWTLHQSWRRFRDEVSASLRRDLGSRGDREAADADRHVAALVKLFVMLENQGASGLGIEATAQLWRRGVTRLGRQCAVLRSINPYCGAP